MSRFRSVLLSAVVVAVVATACTTSVKVAGPSCDDIDDAVKATKLAALDVGSPGVPLPKGYDEVGAAVRPPSITLSEVSPSELIARHDKRHTTYVVGRMDGDVSEIRNRVEESLRAGGFTIIRNTASESNGKPSQFTIGYEGGGTTGEVGHRSCGDGARVLFSQVVRPDRVGPCRQPELHERCSTLLAHAAAVLEEPSDGPTAPEGSQDFRPLSIEARPDGKLQAGLHFTNGMKPLTIVLMELRTAFERAGWTRTDVPPCDAQRQLCMPPSDPHDAPVDFAYGKPGYRATGRVAPATASGRTAFTFDGTVGEA